MKLLQRLKHGLPNTLLMTCITSVAGLCSGIILARTLSPISRGEFAVILLWPVTLASLGELGLGFAFSFYAGRDKDSLDGLWALACVVSFIWGGLLSLGGILIVPEFVHLSEEGFSCLIWNMITIPFSLLTGYSAYLLLGLKHIYEFNLVRFSATIVYTFGIILIAILGSVSIENYTIVFILSQLVSCVVSIWFVLRCLSPSLRWQQCMVRPVFIYGGKTYLSSLSAQMNLRLDQLLMSSLIPVVQLGYYVIAVSFSSLLMPLFNALSIVTLPRVTQSADLKTGGLQIIRYLQLGFVIGLPVMLIGMISASLLLPMVFGQQYMLAVPLGQILLLAVVFQGSNIILGNGLRGLGHPGKTAISEGIGLVVTIVLLACMLPQIGSLGAALASLIAYALVMFIQMFYVTRSAGLKWSNFLVFSWGDLHPVFDILKQWQIKMLSVLKRSQKR